MKELIEKIARQREIISLYKKELETMKSLRDQAATIEEKEDLSCEVIQIISRIEDCEINIREYEGYLNDPFESPEERIEELERLKKLFNEAEDKQARIKEIKKAIEALENTSIDELIEDMEERYEELLDEVYPEVKIGYCSFNPSRIIRELDPIAFRCGMNDYADSLASDIQNLAEWYTIQEKIDELEKELEELEEGED